MMNQDDTFDFKQKISNGFADSILASSPTKNGSMNANSLGDGCDSGEGDHDHLMHDINSKEKSGFSQSGSPSPSPDSCSPCPNGEDEEQSDQYDKESSHHMALEGVWENSPAAVAQFTNQGGRKDGDSGFISPEGATNGPGVVEGKSLLDGASLHSDLRRQSSDGLMEFEVNRTTSLDVEIDSKPLDLSLDSDVDGLASSLPDKNEEINDEDFDIIEDINKKNKKDEIDNFSCEKMSYMTNDNDHLQVSTKEDAALLEGKTELQSNDDGLGLEQDEILEDELTKSKLELKNSTDSEKEKEVNTHDYEYRLKEDDGCQEFDPMTTSMIQSMDPMTSSMINFDTQTINHSEGESESLQMNENNLMQNEEHQGVKIYASSSEDEEDHTEKKDEEKDHSSSSSSDSEEDEATKKDHVKKNKEKRSSSSSSSEDEDKEQNDSDMEALIDNNESSEIVMNNIHDEKETSKDLEKDLMNKHTLHGQPSSSDEENEINDDDKDMGSEKDLIPYNTMQEAAEEQSSEDEEEKDKSDEKHEVPEVMEFTPREFPDAPSKNKEAESEGETDNDKDIVENPHFNNFNICPSAAVDSSLEYEKKESDDCFDKREMNQDNTSSILGDVCAMPDMHSDEVKMSVEEDVFADDKSADNVHPEDERVDCKISNAESRSEFRKNSLGSASSDDANEHDNFESKKLSVDTDLMVKKSEEEKKENDHEILCDDESFQSNEEKNLGIFPVKHEDVDFEVVNQNVDLPNKSDDGDICYKQEIDAVEKMDIAQDCISSNIDNDESEDVIMKESMVTNISEGRPADFGFELGENIDQETREDSPTIQTEFSEKNEIAQDNSKGAFLEQTSSKIESNEYCYQENEETSLDLASLNSQVPVGQLSCGEIVENAAVSPVDENLMVDNMSNIKETELLVETSTNLAASQKPSEIFSQNDEHMAQKVSEFGVNGEYENSNDNDETNNCFEDNSTKDTSFEISKPVEKDLVNSDNDKLVNAPKEMYENTTFELNSTEKDSVFEQQSVSEAHKISETADDLKAESNHVDNETVDMNSHSEISTENELKLNSVACNEAKEDIIEENTNFLNTDTPVHETKNLGDVKDNELERQPEYIESNGFQQNLQEENEECTDIKHKENEEEFKEESVNLIQEAKIDSLVEKSEIIDTIGDQIVAVTELPIENEIVTEKVSEIDLQTGIQDSEQAIEIETTKEPQVETHLTSQELNANTSTNIENAEDVKKDTADTSLEPSIISLPAAPPVEETKKAGEPIEDKTESAPLKKTSKPTPKAATASRSIGSASKPSKPSAPTSTRKTDAKSSPRPSAATPKAPTTKAGPAGGQASASRRSVPPAKPNTTAPKTTVGSAPSANASKPGTTAKPQTNGVSRPTSATTRTTTRPASARPATTPSAAKTPTSRPQTAKPSSATAKAPSSRPATAGTTKAPTTARTPLSTRTTPLTRPSPVPSTLRPRPTSTSRLRAASATRKAQAASATNGTSKTPLISSKPAPTRTPLSRPTPRTPSSSTATTKAQTKPSTTTARSAPAKTTPARPASSRLTPVTKKPAPATKTPSKPGNKTPASKGSSKPVAIKKPSAENTEENNKEENEVNGLSNGVHPITNGVNGVHSDEEGQSLGMNGCNGALDLTEKVH